VDRNIGLFLPLGRHPSPDLCQKPALKFLTSLQYSATDDQGIWVESIYHFVEKQSKRVGLNPENLFAHRVALIRQAADGFGRLVRVLLPEFVFRIVPQKIWEKGFLDRGE
jgi:hypothetical protein